jgi:hypothetical protein
VEVWQPHISIYENVVLFLNVQGFKGRPSFIPRASLEGSGGGGRLLSSIRPGGACGHALITSHPGSTVPMLGEVDGATALMSLSRRPMGVVSIGQLKVTDQLKVECA